jgi:hypothetical protein
MSDQLALRFERERESKNTVRYQELAGDGEQVVGSLYVRKAELARLGDPRELMVIVRATSAATTTTTTTAAAEPHEVLAAWIAARLRLDMGDAGAPNVSLGVGYATAAGVTGRR